MDTNFNDGSAEDACKNVGTGIHISNILIGKQNNFHSHHDPFLHIIKQKQKLLGMQQTQLLTNLKIGTTLLFFIRCPLCPTGNEILQIHIQHN